MIITPVSKQHISKKIPPNYSSWQTIEYTNQCCRYVLAKRIPGDFVECGVAAGNNLASMAAAGRHAYGFDSFQGIPWAGEHDTQQPGRSNKLKSKIGKLESSGVTVHPIKGVHENLRRFGVGNYTLIEGWFQHTVPGWKAPNGISVLRLDGDLYDSTYICLEHLYPQLSEGGILIIDDWLLTGCHRAFMDYFKDKEPMTIFDDGVRYFQK